MLKGNKNEDRITKDRFIEEQKEQTKQRNAQIYQLIKSGEKTFEDIAEEYDLKLPTVKRIYKEYKED